MIHEQNTKALIVTSPRAILDNGSWTTNQIDTKGYDYCTIYVVLGATDIALSVLKVQESITDGSNFADVTGLVYGTSNNIAGSASTLPSATDDNKIFIFDIDLKNRNRYLDLVATIGDGTVGGFISAIAILSRSSQGITTAAERGASQVLRV